MIMVVIYRMKNIDLLLKRLRGGGIMITLVITPVNIYIYTRIQKFISQIIH